jgi:hypothetical protein
MMISPLEHQENRCRHCYQEVTTDWQTHKQVCKPYEYCSKCEHVHILSKVCVHCVDPAPCAGELTTGPQLIRPEPKVSNYKAFLELISELPVYQSMAIKEFIASDLSCIHKAAGSSHNHQAWEGGWFHHIQEVMNIAIKLYATLNGLRSLPFSLQDALLVLVLHDLEKPFRHVIVPYTKENRKEWRETKIAMLGIALTPEQQNALRYVEGVPDSEYTPSERTMNELAAFCHMCDICSARIWHDKGSESAW